MAFSNPLKMLMRSTMSILINSLDYAINFLSKAKSILIVRRKIYFDFHPRPLDIFIVTYPKSGTTWLQAIMYELIHGDNQRFSHISEVSPFFEKPYDDRHLRDLIEPRIIKSHLHHKDMPIGRSRYIYVIRNPTDVLVSHYYHDISFTNYKGSFDQYFKHYVSNKVYKGLWARHVSGWLKNKNKLNVLYIYYEDLQNNFAHELNRIASFCGETLSPERVEGIRDNVAFKKMKANQEKYDYFYEKVFEKGWKKDTHIRKGKTNQETHFWDTAKRKILKQEMQHHLKHSDVLVRYPL